MTALITLIPTLLSGIREAVNVVNAIRTAARQSGEMTAEQDAAYELELRQMFGQAHWKPKD